MNNLLMYILIPVIMVPYLLLLQAAYIVVEREDKVAEEWVKAGAKYNQRQVQLLVAPKHKNRAQAANHNRAA
ncbi:MAG: hypothetical protein V7739_01110 [Motiliproteus sp.]